MSTSNPKAKAVNSVPVTSKEKPLGGKVMRTSQAKQFSAVVDLIAKRYGVKVAAVSTPTTNPYAMSAEQAEKVALQAGIITRAGNLTHRFK